MSHDRAGVPINPPPWGPARDPHFTPQKQLEGVGGHQQATVEDALLARWWFRSEWYKRLVPDTRRCRIHGEIMFEEQQLSQADLDRLYVAQNAGMATGPLAG
jgi:hypothetical protein